MVLRAVSVMRRLILLCFQNEEPPGQFSHNLSSVSHVVQSPPLWFQMRLFMNQLAAVIQLEANIIGQQLWMGSIFARPCCKRGLPCGCARTFCHSSPNARAATLHTQTADAIREEDVQLSPLTWAERVRIFNKARTHPQVYRQPESGAAPRSERQEASKAPA